MGLRINQNVEALNSHRNLINTSNSMSKSMEKLSSGLRINRAADDAAGLAISEKLRSQIRGLNQAVRNAQDGISLIQTAEGALNETHSILQRMRELAIQASSDTYTDSDRGQIQTEISQLVSEVDRISTSTEFNGMSLVSGSFASGTGTLEFQIGANAGQTIDVNIGNMGAASIDVATIDLSTKASAQSALASIGAAIDTVSGQRANLGAVQNRLEHTVSNLGVAAENLTASESRIRDVDMAEEMVNFTKAQILQQAGTAMLAQANSAPQGVLQLLK